jgi:hypothetical protein
VTRTLNLRSVRNLPFTPLLQIYSASSSAPRAILYLRYGLIFSCRKIALSLFSSDFWESARIPHIVIAEAKNKVSANARTSSAQSDFEVSLTCGPSNHSHSPSTIPPTTLLTISLFAGIIRSTSRCCFCWVHYAEAYVYR